MSARKLLSQFFLDPGPAIIRSTHHVDSKMSRLGRTFLRISPHYGEARTNRADRVGLIWVICLDYSTAVVAIEVALGRVIVASSFYQHAQGHKGVNTYALKVLLLFGQNKNRCFCLCFVQNQQF